MQDRVQKSKEELRIRAREVRKAWRLKNRDRLNQKARERRKNKDFKKKERELHDIWRRGVGKERADFQRRKSYKKMAGEKRAAMQLLGGDFCHWCGCPDIRCLEINHIKGGGARERREKKNAHGARLYHKIVINSIDRPRFNVLCRACNALDHLFRKYPDLEGKGKVTWNINVKKELQEP